MSGIRKLMFGASRADTDTNAQGQSLVFSIGHSIERGSAGDGVGVACSPGTAYCTVDGVTITQITNDDINPALAIPPGTLGTPWPRYCKDRYDRTGNKMVIGMRAIAGSKASEWVSTYYAPAKAAIRQAMNTLGVTKLKFISFQLGINDVAAGTSAATTRSNLYQLIDWLTADFPDTEIRLTQEAQLLGGTDSSNLLTSLRKTIVDICNDYEHCSLHGSIPALASNGLLMPDLLHPAIAGCEAQGKSKAKYEIAKEAGCSKWACSIIACHFDLLSNSQMTAWNTWVNSMGINYSQLEYYFHWKTSDARNALIDWTFLNLATNNGGNQPVLTLNDSLYCDGASKIFRTNFRQSINQNRGSRTDGFVAVKLKKNYKVAGEFGSLIALYEDPSYLIIDQFTVPANRYRYGFTYTPAGGSLSFQSGVLADNKLYHVEARGGNQYFYVNGLIIDGPFPQGSGSIDFTIEDQVGNNSGLGSGLTSDLHYAMRGKASTTDKAVIYNACETLLSNW